jgi:hypothetical protein
MTWATDESATTTAPLDFGFAEELLSSTTVATEELLSSKFSKVPLARSIAALQDSSASQSEMAWFRRVHIFPVSPSTNGGP